MTQRDAPARKNPFSVLGFVLNAILERLNSERADQVAFIDNLLERAETENRDLVETEITSLEAARERINEIDAQVEPLVEFENKRAAGTQINVRNGHGNSPTPVSPVNNQVPEWSSPGAYLVDYARSLGVKRGDGRYSVPPDDLAKDRITRVLENEVTGDVPGVLPEPIIGPVVDLMDRARPFITSIGARPLGGIPGTTFSRPKVTQRPVVGQQTAEKTELPSGKLLIDPITFQKETYGGAVNVSYQTIDWTSPSAWDVLIRDLADVYGTTVEGVAASDFASKVTQTVPRAGDTLADWTSALYQAAALVYQGTGRLPDRLWVSVDQWAQLGALVDVARVVSSPANNAGFNSGSNLASFAGDVLALPRIVVPQLPEGTVVVGVSSLYEFYEQAVGLLTAIEPSLLGVEVAYGGYVAYGVVEANGFAKVTAPGS